MLSVLRSTQVSSIRLIKGVSPLGLPFQAQGHLPSEWCGR